MSTDVKILQSSCCATGASIKQKIERIAGENGIDVSVEELSDIQETAQYGTSTFPSLVVDDQVYDYNKISSDTDLLSVLSQ